MKLIKIGYVLVVLLLVFTTSCDNPVTEKPIHTLEFHANNSHATGSMETISAEEGSAVVIADNQYTLTGHRFIGWNTQNTGSGTSYGAGDSVTLNSSMVLYAQWEAVTLVKHNISLTISGMQADTESIDVNISQAVAGQEVQLYLVVAVGRAASFFAYDVAFSQESIAAPGGTVSFTMPDHDVNIDVEFFDAYRIKTDSLGARSSEGYSLYYYWPSTYWRIIDITSNHLAPPGAIVRLRAKLDENREIRIDSTGVDYRPEMISPKIIVQDDWYTEFFMADHDLDFQLNYENRGFNVFALASSAEENEGITFSSVRADPGDEITIYAQLNWGREVFLRFNGNSDPSEPWYFGSISEDGGTATFIMPAKDAAIEAHFRDRPTYPINLNYTEEQPGEALEISTNRALPGDTVTITAKLNSRRKVLIYTPDHRDVPAVIDGNNGSVTFTMPNETVNITGEFSYISYGISIEKTGNAASSVTITASNSMAVETLPITLYLNLKPGETVNLSSSDVRIAPSLFENSSNTTQNYEAYFTMPGRAVNISAECQMKTYSVSANNYNYTGSETLVTNPSEAVPGETITLTVPNLGVNRRAKISDTVFPYGVVYPAEYIESDLDTVTFIMPERNVLLDVWYSDTAFDIDFVLLGNHGEESITPPSRRDIPMNTASVSFEVILDPSRRVEIWENSTLLQTISNPSTAAATTEFFIDIINSDRELRAEFSDIP